MNAVTRSTVMGVSILMLPFVLLSTGCIRRHEPVDKSPFGQIKLGMSELEVIKLLKGISRDQSVRDKWIHPVGWPRTLSEIPGWEKQIGGWHLDDSTSIEWHLWLVNDEHKWIAVGFVDDECCGTLGPLIAAIKKSGLKDTLRLEADPVRKD
jgi:hypothetical protein